MTLGLIFSPFRLPLCPSPTPRPEHPPLQGPPSVSLEHLRRSTFVAMQHLSCDAMVKAALSAPPIARSEVPSALLVARSAPPVAYLSASPSLTSALSALLGLLPAPPAAFLPFSALLGLFKPPHPQPSSPASRRPPQLPSLKRISSPPPAPQRASAPLAASRLLCG